MKFEIVSLEKIHCEHQVEDVFMEMPVSGVSGLVSSPQHPTPSMSSAHWCRLSWIS